MKSIINKQARYDYEILETLEAGLVLKGHEVKAVKNGQLNLKGSYISIRHRPEIALYLINANISKYKKAGFMPDYDPLRPRKLLLHKKEIKSLIGKLQQKGLTLVPIKVYTKNSLIKLEFGIGKGKKKFDKRQTIKKREIDREIRRSIKGKI